MNTNEEDFYAANGPVALDPTATQAQEDAAHREGDFRQQAASRTSVYEEAKAAKVGTTIACPQCGKLHVKTTYHKVFCSNGKVDKAQNCKDKFWNFATEDRRGRTRQFAGR